MYVINMCMYQSHRDKFQLMESVMEAAALRLASPISIKPCSSVAGFHGRSGLFQLQRLGEEELDRTLLSTEIFIFVNTNSCVFVDCCYLTVITLVSL